MSAFRMNYKRDKQCPKCGKVSKMFPRQKYCDKCRGKKSK